MYVVLGTGGVSKMDEFLETFQTAFDHPPQGPTGRGFLLRDGTGWVLAKKFGYWDGSGRVVRKF